MLNGRTELKEFSAESEFDWNLAIFSKIDWDKNYVIMSDEVNFKEANAKWSLKLSSCTWGAHNIFVVSKFYVRGNSIDKNAKFKFEILLKDGTTLSSPIIPNMNSTFEYEMKQYIPIMEGDNLEITPKVTFYTLKVYKEVPQKAVKALNEALETMIKAEKEAEEEKIAFKALNDALEDMNNNHATKHAQLNLMDAQVVLEDVDAQRNVRGDGKDDQETLSDAQDPQYGGQEAKSSQQAENDDQQETHEYQEFDEKAQKAFKVFNNVIESIKNARDEYSILNALTDVFEAMNIPQLAQEVTEEDQESQNSKDSLKGQEDTSDDDFDHCSDAEFSSDDQQVQKAFKEISSDTQAAQNAQDIKMDTQEPQNDDQDEQKSQLAQSDAQKSPENTSDEEFDHCSDVETIDGVYRSEVIRKPCCTDETCKIPPPEVDYTSDESDSIEIPHFGKIALPVSETRDKDLSKLISNIYLNNMKMISDASAALLIFAAKNNNQKLLDDCSSALASQMNLKNFFQIWEVADKLKIVKLKERVIQFASDNSFKAWYHRSISPNLMRDYVNSK